MGELASVLGGIVVFFCTGLVVVRALVAPAVTDRRVATPSERAELARAIASAEPDWEKDSAKAFPADRWSESDDFAGHEYRKATELAKDKDVRVDDVLRGVDEDLHRVPQSANSPDVRRAHAVSCKPRPIYD
jgi:hypothetical protein